jgi:hypothetical protein
MHATVRNREIAAAGAFQDPERNRPELDEANNVAVAR